MLLSILLARLGNVLLAWTRHWLGYTMLSTMDLLIILYRLLKAILSRLSHNLLSI